MENIPCLCCDGKACIDMFFLTIHVFQRQCCISMYNCQCIALKIFEKMIVTMLQSSVTVIIIIIYNSDYFGNLQYTSIE